MQFLRPKVHFLNKIAKCVRFESSFKTMVV
jgi:hypothetical protein